MGKFLITLSGARPDVLEKCPTERGKFQSLGWAILITSTMAVISMWFALTSVMGFNPILMFPVAVIWGLIIMGIDRWLIISLPADGSRRFLIALPRLALALLLGTVISTPIVLRVFQSEINNRISIIKENSEASFLASQQHSQIAARVATWTKTVSNLQQVIDSRGQQAINPTSDPQIQSWNKQLTSERSTAATDYKQWQCQLYGGCGAPKGPGPLAAASKARYESDESQISTLTGEIAAREKQLQDTSAAAQQTRLQQAQSALPNAKAQLQSAQAEENSLTSNFETTNNATNGLLIRLEALDQLSAGSGTLNMARILLFLLFLLIECLPVTVKLLQQPGNYERILAATAKRDLNKAHRTLREEGYSERTTRSYTRFTGGRRWNSQDWSAQDGRARDGATFREPADDEFGGYSRTRASRTRDWAGGDPIDDEITDIWRTGGSRDRTRPRDTTWQGTAPNGAPPPPPPPPDEPADPDPAGPTPQDDPLRDVTDHGQEDWLGATNGGTRPSENLYGDNEI